MSDIVIRRLRTGLELELAVELQKVYWEDGDALVPAHMLQTLTKSGGHVLGAYDGDKLVGFVMGFIGTDIDYEDPDARPAMANLLILSKRMVVLSEYRGQNLGYLLKMAQREVAMKQGIRLITWSFDPLLAANAHLNIRKLGGVIQQYKMKYYEPTSHDSLRGDRVLVDWWVTHQRVKERAKGTTNNLTLKQYFDVNTPIVNRADISGELIRPRAITDVPHSTFAMIEIPLNFREIIAKDSDLTQAWCDHIQEVFLKMMSAGYIVTDFVRGEFEGKDRTFYLLSHDSGQDDRLN
jgi:chorismate synthase